ncbi:Alpha/Beta hydrolase protein [Infundibulicybe gibba]|nr:Alpha/Beta hydrolase protein [Infundibulicybe gibba]
MAELLAVCLHPWSWLGGRMNDPPPVRDRIIGGRNYYIIRFNSRGVGSSSGWASLTGFSEAKDLEALVHWAMNKIAHVRSLVLVGYSHGSFIASLHPVLPLPIKTSHILISYPLGPRGWLTLFNTGTYATQLQELTNNSDANILVLYGDRDEFTAASKYETWATELRNNATTKNLTGQSGRSLTGKIREWLS